MARLARDGGAAIFLVSNDHTGTLVIARFLLRNNPSLGFETAGYPGIFFIGRTSSHATRLPGAM